MLSSSRWAKNPRNWSSLRFLLAHFLLALLFTGSVALAQDASSEFEVFQPIKARQNPTDFSKYGVTPALNTALRNYQTAPSMTTAIGILKKFKEFHDNAEMRKAVLAADPELFLSVDIAKYELVMQARKMPGVVQSRRCGSSGLREMMIIKWVKAGRPVNDPNAPMPPLNPEEQYYSDDDVTNQTGSAERLADEKVNGARAEEYFEKMTAEKYGMRMHPRECEIEFLSPTEFWPVFLKKYVGQAPPPPDYLYAFVAANPEKYNDPFGIYKLGDWGYDKGVLTRDVQHPKESTIRLKEVQEAPHDPPEEGVFSFIGDNYRQIYVVHEGKFKSQCKYLMRNIDAWIAINLTRTAKGEPGLQLPTRWTNVREMAEAIYKKGTNLADFKPITFDGITISSAAEFERHIGKIIADVTTTTHDFQLDRVGAELSVAMKKMANEKGSGGLTMEKLGVANPKLMQELDGLMVAYTNIPPDVHQRLMQQFKERIQRGEASQSSLEVFNSHLFKYVMDEVQKETVFQRGNINAFRNLREQVKANVDEGLKQANVEDFVEKIAKGEFKADSFEWEGLRLRRKNKILGPQEVKRYVEVLYVISDSFNDSEKERIRKVKEFIQGDGNPNAALALLQKAYKIFDSSGARSVPVTYTDEQGNQVTREVMPSRGSLAVRLFVNAVSAGEVGVKVGGVALKGGEWWGHIQNGKDLFVNMNKVFGENGGLTDEQIGQSQAALLANSINFTNLISQHGPGLQKWKVPLSGVLTSNTVGVLGSSAGAVGMNAEANEALFYAALKDLVVLYEPHLAAAIVLIDLAHWGYTEWSISGARNEIIDAMVENGVWEPATFKELGTLKPDELPQLKGIREREGGAVRPVASLAKVDFANMTLIESKREINPRETLLKIGYDTGYIDADPVVKSSMDALNEISGSWVWRFLNRGYLPKHSKDWTKKAVEDALKVRINSPEDDKAATPRADQITVDENQSHPLGTNQIRLAGLMMADFWTKRQKVLENGLLPGLEKEAKRRWLEKLKAEEVAANPSKLMDEVGEIYKQVRRIDERVWPLMARSAYPATYPRIDANYDPEKHGTPIMDSFMKSGEIQQLGREIQEMQDFLNSGKGIMPSNTIPQGPGAMPPALDRKQAIEVANKKLKEMRDYYYKLADGYDQVARVLGDGSKLVDEGKVKVDPFYVTFAPGSWSLREITSAVGGDLAAAKSWLDGYQQARKVVLRDIAAKGQGAPESSPLKNLFLEISAFIDSVKGKDAAHTYSPAHPLWPRLVKLRYQTRSLEILRDYAGRIEAREMRDVVTPMTIKGDEHVAPKDSDLSDSYARSVFITNTIAQMEEEYRRLLESLTHLFDVNIAVNLDKPYIGQEIEVTGKAKLNPDQPETKLRADGFPEYAAQFRWIINDKRWGTEVVSNVLTDTPKLTAKIPKTGEYQVKLAVLDKGGNVVAKSLFDGPQAQTLLIWGKINIIGDLDKSEKYEVTVGDLRFPLQKDGEFSIELEEFKQEQWENSGLRAKAKVESGGKLFLSNDSSVEITPSKGILKLKDDLNVALPFYVMLNVDITDKSGQKVPSADATILVEGVAQPKGTSAKARLAPGDSFSAIAEYAPLGIKKHTTAIAYDTKLGRQVNIKAELPIYDTGHFIAFGHFVPDASLNPKPQLTGGEVTANVGNGRVEQGAFSFKNEKPIDLMNGAQFEAQALVTDAAGKRYRPKEKIIKQIIDNELDLGAIEVSRAGMTVRPIQVQLFDWTGRQIQPSAGPSQVLIAGVPAARQGDIFVGEHTFTDENEDILIEGNFTLPNGMTSTVQQHLTVRDLGGWQEKPPPPPLYKFKLPIYLPGSLRVNGRTRIEGVPKNHSAPGFVNIVDAAHEVNNETISNTAFDFTFPVAVFLTENIALRISAKDSDITYQGFISTKAPNGDNSLDVGEVVLNRTSGGSAQNTEGEVPESVTGSGEPPVDDVPPSVAGTESAAGGTPGSVAAKNTNSNQEPPEPIAGSNQATNSNSSNELPESVAGANNQPPEDIPEPATAAGQATNQTSSSASSGNNQPSSSEPPAPAANTAQRNQNENNRPSGPAVATGTDDNGIIDMSGTWIIVERAKSITRTWQLELRRLGPGTWAGAPVLLSTTDAMDALGPPGNVGDEITIVADGVGKFRARFSQRTQWHSAEFWPFIGTYDKSHFTIATYSATRK